MILPFLLRRHGLRLVVLPVSFAIACSEDAAFLRSEDYRLASSGDLNAMHGLCYGFSYGESELPKDYIQARAWCAAAAERGAASGQTLYAELLEHGDGGPTDYAAAARWYRQAADQGHIHALFVLGRMYHDGRGVNRDSTFGDSLLLLAAEQGYELARQELGLESAPE